MKLIKDFLDSNTLQLCNLDLENKLKNSKWNSNRPAWGEHLLVGLKGDVLATPIDPDINQMIKTNLISHFPNLCDNDTEIRSQYFQWQIESGISTHPDHLFKFVATFYLNQEWQVDYGGIFLWHTSDNELKAFCPKYNHLMVDTETLPHSVTPVTHAAPEPRYTIQILGMK